ncbi:hypothetical protein GCM10009836_70290 [Pseudonocardia ailaonensis]|uniref:Histidine kinase/HSP90-like ATPase domain-containing protein n=1 Tax=Pseudonocardia ailaonensis TaxID=367279 RepID=A0ABN2NNW6_9PSEU
MSGRGQSGGFTSEGVVTDTRTGGDVADPEGERRAAARYVTAFEDAALLPGLRGWIRAQLAGRAETSVVDAELVCTELVTNAVEHASGPRAVRIVVEAERLRIEVDDTTAGGPTPGRSRFGGFRGRGLVMVGRLARWGVRAREDGKTVWADLALG